MSVVRCNAGVSQCCLLMMKADVPAGRWKLWMDANFCQQKRKRYTMTLKVVIISQMHSIHNTERKICLLINSLSLDIYDIWQICVPVHFRGLPSSADRRALVCRRHYRCKRAAMMWCNHVNVGRISTLCVLYLEWILITNVFPKCSGGCSSGGRASHLLIGGLVVWFLALSQVALRCIPQSMNVR